LLDGSVGGADGFDAVTAKVVRGVFHVSLGATQRGDGFADLRMGFASCRRGVDAEAGLPLGAAWLPTVNAKARIQTLAISKRMLLVFMHHSPQAKFGRVPKLGRNDCGGSGPKCQRKAKWDVPGKAQGACGAQRESRG
jgi:hypothetical protein